MLNMDVGSGRIEVKMTESSSQQRTLTFPSSPKNFAIAETHPLCQYLH